MDAGRINDFIAVNDFCVHHEIEISFLNLLQQSGLIDLTVIKSEYFIEKEQIPQLEKYIHFYYDLDINLEGIETITYLLHKIEIMQNEITGLQNKLRFYEAQG